MNTTVLEKIQSELERSGCDAFLLSGGDNMRYAAQVHLPFTDEHPGLAFVLFAKGRLPLVLSPSLWARSWERGIISDVRAYPGSLDATHAAAELAAFLRPLGLASIGLDMNRASVALRDALGEWALTDISAAISAIRQIKSAEEAAFLEDLAYRADHAILGAAHHSLACDARAEKGQAELIRMHALERGFEAVGYNGISQSATGAHAKDYWAESPKFGIGQGKDDPRRNEPP
ncbi:MAG: aminopeptidase P family N-terminal domain-containing protein [Bilophila wadsworthia]